MPELLKPKGSSQGKPPAEPDFSPFEDWLIDGPAGTWPKYWELEEVLTNEQMQIVADNVRKLTNKQAWLKKVQAFEAALAALADEAQQKIIRAKYQIRFDQHVFKSGPKDFSGYPFPCYVSFQGANFSDGYVSFDRANFSEGSVSFRGANFGKGTVWFQEVNFRSTTMSAVGMVVAGNLTVKSHFLEAADFRRLYVEGTARFSGSIFEKVPNFRDAKFDRPPEVAGMVVPRPKLAEPNAWVWVGRFTCWHRGVKDTKAKHAEQAKEQKADLNSGDAKIVIADTDSKQRSWPSRIVVGIADRVRRVSTSIFRLAADPDDVAKFRKLKAMALAANDHEKDGEFFAGEMLAKRGTETPSFFGLLFNTIYWWLSGFGQSFVLPLIWLLGSFFSFAGICLYLIRDALTLTDRLWFAADFSFRNMLPLFGSLFRFAVAPEGHVSWYQKTYDRLATTGVDIDRLIVLGIFQNLIGTVLLFLFLLALRNKFRLK